MFYADLHIHSRYSRATSRDCDAGHLGPLGPAQGHRTWWAPGISPTPPGGRSCGRSCSPAEEGLYTPEGRRTACPGSAWPRRSPALSSRGRSAPSTSRAGKARKVHNVILLPSLEAAEALSRRLEAIGNIHSDGRPILGLDSRDLLEITLGVLPPGRVHPRPHLDAPLLPVWRLLRV